MPCVNDDRPKGPGPFMYVLYGCGGCLVVYILASVVMGMFFMRAFHARSSSRGWSTSMSSRSSSLPHPTLDRCEVPVPRSPGLVINVELRDGGFGPAELLLEKRFQSTAMKGLLYYRDSRRTNPPPSYLTFELWSNSKQQKNYLKIDDTGGEAVIDLDTCQAVAVSRKRADVYGYSNVPGHGGFAVRDSRGRIATMSDVPLVNGIPPAIASALAHSTRTALGSVQRKGNTLAFTPPP